MIICKHWFELYFFVNQRCFSTIEIAGADIVNFSQNITVSYSTVIIYAANDVWRWCIFAVTASFYDLGHFKIEVSFTKNGKIYTNSKKVLKNKEKKLHFGH